MAEFKQVLRGAKNIIAVCGAGLSAASGVGDVWRKYDAMSLATPEAFEENPALVWQFYHYRREKARAAEPNAAHMALARRAVAPDAGFSLITQNVDGLSVRALDTVLQAEERKPAGVAPLLEMHGRIMDVSCTMRLCGHVESNPRVAHLRGPGRDGRNAWRRGRSTRRSRRGSEIAKGQLPRCGKCGALGRPGVVWFGEMPRYLGGDRQVGGAGGSVSCGGDELDGVPRGWVRGGGAGTGGGVAVFNLERSEGDEYADFCSLGHARRHCQMRWG
ncbi:NAD-dependent protein deacylase [Mycena olivaceomarginata]|nr:NAD-dependent protein deacylase [Mycena olivaceomarginata]